MTPCTFHYLSDIRSVGEAVRDVASLYVAEECGELRIHTPKVLALIRVGWERLAWLWLDRQEHTQILKFHPPNMLLTCSFAEQVCRDSCLYFYLYFYTILNHSIALGLCVGVKRTKYFGFIHGQHRQSTATPLTHSSQEKPHDLGKNIIAYT